MRLDKALRICSEWSSEAIYFSTHQFKLFHNKIIKELKKGINSLLAKLIRLKKRHFLTFVYFGNFALKET